MSIQFEITCQADEYWGGRRNKNSLTAHSFVMRFYCLVFLFFFFDFCPLHAPSVSQSNLHVVVDDKRDKSRPYHHAAISFSPCAFQPRVDFFLFYRKEMIFLFWLLANTNLFEFPLFLKYQIKIDNAERNAGVGIYPRQFVNPVPLPFNCLSSFAPFGTTWAV